jgi:ring-1,2-phenylacetyl-CoA epoxidase subunit PaaD
MVRSPISEERVWGLLGEIPDPEIPTINLVDLGVIRRVEVGERITVEMLPTFTGCPALDMMQRDIKEKLSPLGEVAVKIVYDEAWGSERITPAGREMLLEAGLAPPPATMDFGDLDELPLLSAMVACPRCGSKSTRQESLFGPTPCRAIYYCARCQEPFEGFKPL